MKQFFFFFFSFFGVLYSILFVDSKWGKRYFLGQWLKLLGQWQPSQLVFLVPSLKNHDLWLRFWYAMPNMVSICQPNTLHIWLWWTFCLWREEMPFGQKTIAQKLEIYYLIVIKQDWLSVCVISLSKKWG